MFESLASRLGDIFDGLRRRGLLAEADVTAAMREVRIALLEADVAVDVVRSFIERVQERAVGQAVLRSVSPAQQVVKIVHDSLVEMLGPEGTGLDLRATPPVPVLMVGLQGGGKTTTTAKIAARLVERDKKKVMMASLDIYRPAAREQLRSLGEQTDVFTLPIAAGETVPAIVKRAMTVARLQGYDVVLLDTAGRVSIDHDMMEEARQVRDMVTPAETLLVADAMTGQDAVNTARNFHEGIGLTGIVLTRMDGDARGGAALSMRSVTGVPVKMIGTGEKMDALEDFRPDGVAGSILGMGDVVSFVEKAAKVTDAEEAERAFKKLQKGQFDLEDMRGQLESLMKVGGLSGFMSHLPGAAKAVKKLENSGYNSRSVARQVAIIQSMTMAERRRPKLLNASRKRRVATGSGTTVPEINRLLKQLMEQSRVIKQLGKTGGLAALSGLAGEPGQDVATAGGFPGGALIPQAGRRIQRFTTKRRKSH